MSRNALLPLSGQGVVLRRLAEGDLNAFQGYRRLPEVGRFQSWTPMSHEQALAFLRESHACPLFVPGAWFQIGIADPITNELLGDIGLCLAPEGSELEIGFTLSPVNQGRGLATEAVRAAVRWVFDHTGVARVIAITDTRNLPSIRLLRRVGMQRIAVQDAVFRGEACQEEIHAINR